MYKDANNLGANDVSTGLDAIKNSIRNILLTNRGSLPGKPRFGSDLYRVLFSPLDALTEQMAKNYIFEALIEFEQRISVKKVQIKRVEEFNRIIIDIYFTFVDPSLNNEGISDSVSITVNV